MSTKATSGPLSSMADEALIESIGTARAATVKHKLAGDEAMASLSKAILELYETELSNRGLSPQHHQPQEEK